MPDTLRNNSLSQFVITDALCNKFLSHFIIPDVLCNKPLLHFTITKPGDNACQNEILPLLHVM